MKAPRKITETQVQTAWALSSTSPDHQVQPFIVAKDADLDSTRGLDRSWVTPPSPPLLGYRAVDPNSWGQ